MLNIEVTEIESKIPGTANFVNERYLDTEINDVAKYFTGKTKSNQLASEVKSNKEKLNKSISSNSKKYANK